MYKILVLLLLSVHVHGQEIENQGSILKDTPEIHPQTFTNVNLFQDLGINQNPIFPTILQKKMEEEKRILLPKSVKPIHYDIHLTPNFENFLFFGTETISIEIIEPTTTVVVNGLGVTVSSAKIIFGANSSHHVAKEILTNVEEETLSFVFGHELEKGNAELSLEFKGELNDKLTGFYRSQYQLDGETKWLATTQFEPADARKAFPCWDEPAIKATFSLTFTTPLDMTVLSNMPPKKETLNEEKKLKIVEFNTTPIVSTYLIAFCIGNFEFLETKTTENITMRVWTTPGKKEMGRFALEVGSKVISYFSEYFQIPYPLPKQDMIAIPDFSAGAMENWGLITYRETALLCNLNNASVAAKSRIAYVVAHELAHQWFRNLVTMEWWKELWLNEGFATFVGSQAVAHFFPEWDIWTQFVADYIFSALQVDSLRNSHPVEVPVTHARAIDEIFDAISYEKGASVIRMIENYLGEDNFRKGLNIYLNRFKYGNAVTEDLWLALSEGSGYNVAQIMGLWTKKIGYPVITVQETPEKGRFKVTQHRFLSSGPPTPEEDQTIWIINLGVICESNPKIGYSEIQDRETIVVVDVSDANEWVKFNAGQSGFYRVSYSRQLSAKLGKAIQENKLTAADRLGIQNDAFALAISGAIPLSQVLELVQNYKNEEEYTVWSDLSLNLKGISSLLAGTDAEPYFSRFILSLYKNISKLGWDATPGEKDLNKLLRTVVLDQLGSHGALHVIEEAKKRFQNYLSDRTSFPADLTGVLFKHIMRNGGEEEYNQMVSIYKSATTPEEKIRALNYIGYSKKPELISKALNYAFSADVRSQDMYYLISSCATTPHGQEITWQYLQDNWDKVLNALSGSNFLLGNIISSSTQSFKTEQKANEVELFFKNRTVSSIERTILQTLESIRGNANTLKNNLQDITAWLKLHYSE